jgi:hypothetical protein
MAKGAKKMRSVNTHFWKDTWASSLTPNEKLMFIYLLTNPLNSMLGIYEISPHLISLETGLPMDECSRIFDKFETDGKVYYLEGYIVIVSWLKNNRMNYNMLISAENEIDCMPSEVREHEVVAEILKTLQSLKEHKEALDKEKKERELEKERDNAKLVNTNHNEVGYIDRVF